MEMETVGVIGAGVMGTGVAQSLVESGFEVILIDRCDVIENVKEQIKRDIRARKLLTGGRAGPDSESLLKLIVTSSELDKLKSVRFVIENVTEKWEVKKEVYVRIDKICSPKAIFAANTSTIPITKIASVTSRPSRVIGLHFMNPAPAKKTVEVISGYYTSEETVAAAKVLLGRMNKECVLIKDSPGFVTNRVLMLAINEAIYLLQDRVATASDIDRIFRECMDHKMGPLETADLIGLDTILFSIEILRESFGDDRYRPCPLLRKMVDAGLLGRKNGSGFYRYDKSEVLDERNGERYQDLSWSVYPNSGPG